MSLINEGIVEDEEVVSTTSSPLFQRQEDDDNNSFRREGADYEEEDEDDEPKTPPATTTTTNNKEGSSLTTTTETTMSGGVGDPSSSENGVGGPLNSGSHRFNPRQQQHNTSGRHHHSRHHRNGSGGGGGRGGASKQWLYLYFVVAFGLCGAVMTYRSFSTTTSEETTDGALGGLFHTKQSSTFYTSMMGNSRNNLSGVLRRGSNSNHRFVSSSRSDEDDDDDLMMSSSAMVHHGPRAPASEENYQKENDDRYDGSDASVLKAKTSRHRFAMATTTSTSSAQQSSLSSAADESLSSSTTTNGRDILNLDPSTITVKQQQADNDVNSLTSRSTQSSTNPAWPGILEDERGIIVNEDVTATTTTTSMTPEQPAVEEPVPAQPATNKSTWETYTAPIPVIHASEVLMCRQSVINFVINATDGKDECDGLIKAYDKTCSNDASLAAEEQQAEQAQQQMQADMDPNTAFASVPADADSTVSVDMRDGKKRTRWHHQRHRTRHLEEQQEEPDQQKQPGGGRRHRRFWEKTERSHRWEVWWYELSTSVHKMANSIFYGPSIFFFAEEAIDDRIWTDAQYVVDNNLEGTVYKDLKQHFAKRADMLKEQERQYNEEMKRRQLQEQQRSRKLQDISSSATTPVIPPVVVEGTVPEAASSIIDTLTTTTSVPVSNATATVIKPTKTLALPSSSAHLSEETLEESLLLRQGDEVITAQLANATAAATTSVEVAAEEAKASAQVITDTTKAVSALLNNPTYREVRTCCASILHVYDENCSPEDENPESYDLRLFLVVLIIALCGMIKSLIRHFKVLWLPEAAGCILVGVLSGYGLMYIPHKEISFDGNWFLRILVPPIIFEAALGIDKRAFNRHVIPIIIFAVIGTLFATILTAIIVHYGTSWSPACPTIPYVESLTFGALISSIDPIAVLSVLSNMGMNDTDTIYVLIFGESLLNDGVAIVLFQTLVHFLDEALLIDSEAIVAATFHFFIVAIGSLLVGVASGMLSTIYFWTFHGCQTSLVEVIMFFCWALLPYYICDGIGWSGIVSAVATGFVMDYYIVGLRPKDQKHGGRNNAAQSSPMLTDESSGGDANGGGGTGLDQSQRSTTGAMSSSSRGVGSAGPAHRRIFGREGHLSKEAASHIDFVLEIISTMMETAIFAYLGLFLFSHRYHWNVGHAVIAIIACCLSRAIMIATLSFFANWITRIQQHRRMCRMRRHPGNPNDLSNPANVIIDKRMQMALWFAGLRGAMSFALVEHIPQYDPATGDGTRMKPELKAMTSSSIIFTVFVLGGATYYVMQNLGVAPQGRRTGTTTSGGLNSSEQKSSSLALASSNGDMDGSASKNGEMDSLMGHNDNASHHSTTTKNRSNGGGSNNNNADDNNKNNNNDQHVDESHYGQLHGFKRRQRTT